MNILIHILSNLQYILILRQCSHLFYIPPWSYDVLSALWTETLVYNELNNEWQYIAKSYISNLTN